jgi:hypothetical protein
MRESAPAPVVPGAYRRNAGGGRASAQPDGDSPRSMRSSSSKRKTACTLGSHNGRGSSASGAHSMSSRDIQTGGCSWCSRGRRSESIAVLLMERATSLDAGRARRTAESALRPKWLAPCRTTPFHRAASWAVGGVENKAPAQKRSDALTTRPFNMLQPLRTMPLGADEVAWFWLAHPPDHCTDASWACHRATSRQEQAKDGRKPHYARLNPRASPRPSPRTRCARRGSERPLASSAGRHRPRRRSFPARSSACRQHRRR